MTTARVLAVATIMMGSAFGLAGPAHADQVMQGIYSYDQGDVHEEWTIYPSCVPTVGDLRDNLELPVACRLHVAPSSARVSGGDARLTGGQWMFSTNIKDGMTCPDGSTAPIQETYEFDDVTLTGTRSVSNSNVCNGQVTAKVVNSPFTLAFARPLPIPVERYPLYCEPGGLKRCF
ncbi:hypothetical protein TUM20985_20660 [Mycobacterium antarcticum]|uniref:hypothetical protein n=1 Tax=unclassified Mycolicibacterium TaxID=2636767 RepID=UPI002384FCC2|nr:MULTISPECIES: hypothetical protein [unclassified Mycolicibacterium]BDX31519.1 hypothetical protein TUM20985_20660 [Mycolicibacterium sp. TUM20985]GLP74866.1 hypothetical protein TUM20983_19760 [Mycolicibacterium sp. TUM20983]GLP80666.1 hypothetical protein TUM20984_20860 [Mycolicibacterium sp. TUM20984]